jgi:SAM-dependent methyltransferase
MNHLCKAKSGLVPAPWQASYLHERSLRVQLAREVIRRLAGRRELQVVDVGCGERPYEDLLRPQCHSYVGVDVEERPTTDVVARAEDLPFPDASFDVVLCTQLLHYSKAPEKVVGEAWRVLKPSGVAFVSTHGVAFIQLAEGDYLRWTYQGLQQLFSSAGEWNSVDVYPNGGSAAALAYLAGGELEGFARRLRTRGMAYAVIMALNAAALRLDTLERRMFAHRPPHGSPNYLVVAAR